MNTIKIIVIGCLVALVVGSAVYAGNWTGEGVTLSTATPAPGGPTPLGASPPSGQSWITVVNDNFDQDSTINTSLWNGGPDGFPMCHTTAIQCGYLSQNTEDCLGFAGAGQGGNECVNTYSGTVNGNNYFASITTGTGLKVMSANNPNDPTNHNYFTETWTGIQNYGNMTLHPGSFAEWRAKMPTDVSGEGDGLHIDLWCAANSRTVLDGAEIDVMEKVMSTSNRASTTAGSNDGAGNRQGDQTYSASGSPNLDAAFHTYGVDWRTGGGSQGNWQLYVDGSSVGNTVNLNSSDWANGAYCFAGWMQQEGNVFPGTGPGIDSSTSTNNPLIVQYFRAWKAQ